DRRVEDDLHVQLGDALRVGEDGVAAVRLELELALEVLALLEVARHGGAFLLHAARVLLLERHDAEDRRLGERGIGGLCLAPAASTTRLTSRCGLSPGSRLSASPESGNGERQRDAAEARLGGRGLSSRCGLPS